MPRIHPWRFSSQNPDDVIMGYASNSTVEDEYVVLRRELEGKTIRQLHEYFTSIGGDERELNGKTKAKIIKHIIRFAKMIAGEENNSGSSSEGGVRRKTGKSKTGKSKTGKSKTRKAKSRKSFFGFF